MTMSVRRQTTNRRTLYRTCGTCGKNIVTTADTPWIRSIVTPEKKQVTTYYCSEKCYAASYKHIGWFDGKADERRRAREAARDSRERCRRYNEAHREERREYARKRREENPGLAAADSAYYRKKRKLIKEEVTV